MQSGENNDLLFLRYALATLAYRAAKVLRGAPDNLADFKAGDSTRTPLQILAHISDLLDWALAKADGKETWRSSTPLPWTDEVSRFFTALDALDRRLRQDLSPGAAATTLFQGPIADALTHVGQIAMLRRLAGSPVRGEDYSRAHIEPGRVGPDQITPAFEFD